MDLDIEDISNEIDVSDRESQNVLSRDRAFVFPKANYNHAEDVEEASHLIPGTSKVWIKTYGCSHNISDSEYMEGMLSNYGFRISLDQDEADVWLVNSCTVKDPSQAAFMNLVKKGKEAGKHVVVAGCVSQADRNVPGLEDVSVVGISQLDRVVEAVEQTVMGNTIKIVGKKELPRLDLPKVRKNPLVEIIPLSTGCLGSCTYCKTKQARGTLGSYSPDSIVARVETVTKEGVAEIWLSSEDTGAYGLDIGTNISELLHRIVGVLPESGVMLRVGMTNPPYMLAHLDSIAAILNHPKVFAFLHVPVQAGSNRVLNAMKREYTVEEFRRVADVLLAKVPEITIMTDIICGFPNETEEDYQKTLDLIEDYKFGAVNISQFYPRPGTPAAKMRRIPTQIVKDRSRRLTKLFESFTPYAHLPGRRMKVWFNTEVSDDGNHSVGHTKSYVKVLVPYAASLPGKSRWVDVLKSSRFHVEGVVAVDQTESWNVQGLPDGGNDDHSKADVAVDSKLTVTVVGASDAPAVRVEDVLPTTPIVTSTNAKGASSSDTRVSSSAASNNSDGGPISGLSQQKKKSESELSTAFDANRSYSSILLVSAAAAGIVTASLFVIRALRNR